MRNVLAEAGKSGRRVVSAFIATAFKQRTEEIITGDLSVLPVLVPTSKP